MEDVITRVPEAVTRNTSTIMGKPLKELTPEENKKYQNLRAIKSRSAKKAREKAVNYKWNSTSELTRSEGLEILSTRITNPHVREVCYDLAVEAADVNQVPFNRFLLAHGLQKVLESKQARTEVQLVMEDAAEAIPSEVIHTGDLYAIWDFSVSSREDISFDDFLPTSLSKLSHAIEQCFQEGVSPLEVLTHAANTVLCC